MKKIAQKTLDDLEFVVVLQQASARCATTKGKEYLLKSIPSTQFKQVELSVQWTAEYLNSFSAENRFPNHGFEAVDTPISLLKIDNSCIEVDDFRRILHLVETAHQLLKFLKKNKSLYPYLFQHFQHLTPIVEIPKEIQRIIDRFGAIQDKASDDLFIIRRQMNGLRGKISQSFGSALSMYNSAGFLDDIHETIIGSRRVLAVKSMYRRKVKGAILGSSKTGSIVYIEPETTLRLSQELQNLEYDEKEEILKILRNLTHYLRPYQEILAAFQLFLTQIDVICAKALYAQEMNAVQPIIEKSIEIDLKKAFHPLLYISNKLKKITTYPQDIYLHAENRILVISGPNAGGKSITLKTIGLVQLMLQTGFLVPVHETSHMSVFENILTDIGDNQSIENELSTYSYRLKNMNRFLKKCNPTTLFLIDEFGTGSDPELGGALAEIFLEVFYERQSFGAITTHYSNLKLLANELPYMSNANMLFDNKSLEPTFVLVTGEAGSSFTFEVAQKNGIPYSIINRAKKKIERGKVRFDATIAKLQKERSSMAKSSKQLQDEALKNKKENERLETLNSKVKTKLERYQELFDHDKRMILLGNKVNDAAEKYFLDQKKRPLISEILRLVEIENSKRKKKSAHEHQKEMAVKKQVKAEVEEKVVQVRKEKKIKQDAPKKIRPKVIFQIGDQVRMYDGKSVGTVERIEKNKALINYGIFTTSVNTEALELVKRT